MQGELIFMHMTKFLFIHIVLFIIIQIMQVIFLPFQELFDDQNEIMQK